MMHTRPHRRPARAYISALRSATLADMLFESLEPRTLFSATPLAPADVIAQANNAFAFDLFHELNKTNTGNLFFSPYSVASALEMTLQGLGGSTAAQVIQALHLPDSDITQAGVMALYQLFQADPATAGYTLSTANRLWANAEFPMLASFLASSQNTFGAGAQTVDFTNPSTAAATINAWVSDQTHGKITNLIDPSMLNALTALVLTNAIYFKGDWATAFDKYGTQDAAFAAPGGDTTVNMMQLESSLGYDEQSGPNGFEAVDLPYQGNTLDMVVILPNGPLDDFESSFNTDLFSQITSNFNSVPVNVSLPKFKLAESYDLVQPLMDLGITNAFNPGLADFSNMFEPNPNYLPYISDVVHKTYIQVDETGSEAAGATAVVVGMMPTCITVPTIPPPPKIFDANHPFMFAIRDRATNTILFMGAVTDPGYDPAGNSPAPPPGQIIPGGGGFLIITPVKNPNPPVGAPVIITLPINIVTPPAAPSDPPHTVLASPIRLTPQAPSAPHVVLSPGPNTDNDPLTSSVAPAPAITTQSTARAAILAASPPAAPTPPGPSNALVPASTAPGHIASISTLAAAPPAFTWWATAPADDATAQSDSRFDELPDAIVPIALENDMLSVINAARSEK